MLEVVDAHIELLRRRGLTLPRYPSETVQEKRRSNFKGSEWAAATRFARADLLPFYLRQLRDAAGRASQLSQRARSSADAAQYRALSVLAARSATAIEPVGIRAR